MAAIFNNLNDLMRFCVNFRPGATVGSVYVRVVR